MTTTARTLPPSLSDPSTGLAWQPNARRDLHAPIEMAR